MSLFLVPIFEDQHAEYVKMSRCFFDLLEGLLVATNESYSQEPSIHVPFLAGLKLARRKMEVQTMSSVRKYLPLLTDYADVLLIISVIII